MIRPPIPYYGGKMTLAPRIVDLLPRHEHYVEPYCGSLAVLMAKPRSTMETVNDLDGDLMTFWRVVRDQPHELARVCALTPHSRAGHQAAYDRAEDLTDLEVARRVWVQLSQGRGAHRRRTGWRHYAEPTSTASFPDYLDGYVRRILPAAERIAGVSLESRPALDLITLYGAKPDVLLYVDPPYLGDTRDSGSYVVEMRSERDHRDLADALRNAAAAVVLSGYPSPLYDDNLYSDWRRYTFTASTGQGGTWASRTEVVWSNRDLDQHHLFNQGGAA